MWAGLLRNSGEAAEELGVGEAELAGAMSRLNAIYDSASDRPAQIAKNKLEALSELVTRDSPDIARVVARLDAHRNDSDIQPLVEELEETLLQWRAE